MSIIAASSTLRYPYEAITDKTDYLQINIFNYTASESLTESSTSTFGTNQGSFTIQSNLAGNSLSKKQLVDNGTIILPMPSNIEDSNSVSYDGDTLNGISAKAFELTTGAMGTDLSSFSGAKDKIEAQIKALGDFLETNQKGLKDLAIQSLAAQAVNVFGANISLNQILARTQGKILNPNMELLFNNVTLRTFRFSFKMTPRDENESLQVKAIIRSFKRNMAAITTSGDNLFLKTPNIFELQYKKGNLAHPFLNKFKQCALSDMSVNYTGENVYATYNDGTPISVILNLTFKELVPIYQSDYPDNEELTYSSTDEIGGVGY